MSKLKLILLTTIISAGGVSMSHAQVQNSDRQVRQVRQDRVNMQRSPIRASSFIRKQHRMLRCGKGETKQLIIHGSPDNFSPAGNESLSKDPRVAANPIVGWNQGNESKFDGTSYNRKVFDSIIMPPNVRSGRVMIGMRTIGELVNTDGFSLGNLSQAGTTANQAEGYAYNNGWGSMTSTGWQNSGTDYGADFNSITLNNGQTLQDYYRNSNDNIIDAYVQDDHSVDYFAVSVCAGKDVVGGGGTNSKKMGMTWGIRTPLPESINGVAHVGCNDKDGVSCDPYKGDTLCNTELPILCLNPMKLQKPQHLTEEKWDKWSGGIIGTTKPMAAPATLTQANSECVKEFGKGWRVAEHHDAYPGSSGWRFSAYGNVGTKKKRYWTDIRNQPNGICWIR